MARTKAATHDQQRQAILDMAAKLFADKGFHATSMSQLAAACGVSKPLLYHYAKDKAEMLFSVADSYMDTLVALVESVEAEQLPPDAHLTRLIARFLETYADAHNQHRVLVQDVRHLDDAPRQQVADKERAVVAAFARAIAAVEPGVSEKGLDKVVAMILFGMVNWTFTWLRANGPLTYEDMAPLVTGILLNGVHGTLGAASKKTNNAPD
ncbi:TetR/AcrR family transcriptional regulator [Denitromonas ohlonensis]|uniref:TetR/AcrR family transcriptional regulator n=2 Tax=Denitromonas TaxID=139331 RepID=A0A557SP20_9RHOO|nr:TetR/AcrR family transcriptional regulator [Denitromonas ohlonensis]TVO67099.1 TetR/AcrR family transcriptional regulator [Denitromonas ohlonensis]TVO79159.1 TetR/AcrR family transcriptional regulator [Denitromonas ohlonensis]